MNREEYLKNKIRETKERLATLDSYYSFPAFVSPKRRIFERQLEELRSQLFFEESQRFFAKCRKEGYVLP